MSWQFSPDIIPYLLTVAISAFLSLLVLLRRQANGAKVFANQGTVQDKLPNPEKYYQILFESTGEAIVLSNLQGEIVECNPSVSIIFGYSRQELVGSPLSKVIDTQSVISGPEAITRFRRNGFSIFEGIGRGKFGREFPIEIRTRQIDFDGQRFIFTQAEDITSRKRVETALQESLAKARSFYKLSRTSLGVEHLPDLLQSMTDGLSDALHADRVITVIFTQDQEKILHYIRGGAESDQVEFLSPEELKQGLTGWVMREKKPALSPKGRPEPRESHKMQNRRRAARSGALLVAPIISMDQVIGTITAIHHLDQPNFTQQDSEFLMAIANQVAIAIQQTSRLEDLQHRLQAAETLRTTGTAVAATLQQDETIEEILEQLAMVVPYDSASVQLLGDGYLEIVGGRGWSQPKSVIGIRFPVPGDNPNTQVIRTRRPHLLGDAASSHSSFFSEPHSHINSWLGVPMLVEDQVIGMLTLDSLNKNFYGEHHVQQALAFAGQVAIAVKNARMYTSQRRRVDELDALRATIADISAELALPRLLKAILQRATLLLDASGGDLGLYDDENDHIIIVASHNMGIDYAGTRMSIGEGVMGKVAALLQPLNIEDYAAWNGQSPQYQSGPWHAVIAVPLLIGGHLIGVIAVVDSNPGRKFTSSDQRLLTLFGQQAAIAIQNANLFAEVQTKAITDSLTGLYNRRGLFELGQRELDRLHRFERPLAAIMLDIDYFKEVNDTYSHAIGDQVLIELAARCRAHLREVDILGRYGGEEFAILLPETGQHDACQVAERMRKHMTDTPVQTGQGPISITISLGVTTADQDTPDLAILLDRADTAMYSAKQSGRNRVVVC